LAGDSSAPDGLNCNGVGAPTAVPSMKLWTSHSFATPVFTKYEVCTWPTPSESYTVAPPVEWL